MAITKVGASLQAHNASATSIAFTARAMGAIGNLVVVGIVMSDSSISPTIADTDGNTWTEANPYFADATNGSFMRSFFANAKSTNSTTITVTGAASPGFMAATLDEYTGNHTSAPLDQNNHSVVGATGTPTSGAITLGANDCVVWAFGSDTITAVGNIDGSAATKGGDDTLGDWSESRILTGRSGVSVTAAFTGSGAYDVLIASFKPAAGASDTLSAQAWM